MKRENPNRAGAHKFEQAPKAKRGRGIPWLVCSHCGLVTLRNQQTRKAMAQPCPGMLDPEVA